MADKPDREECLMHTPPCIRVNNRWERPASAHCPQTESGYHVWTRRLSVEWCVECGLTNIDVPEQHA